MLLKKLLEPQKVKKVIDDIELYFIKLNWKQLVDFQSVVDKIDAENENESTKELTKFILENYVVDRDGDSVIDIDQIELLPVSFCINLVTEFISFSRGDSEEEKKTE